MIVPCFFNVVVMDQSKPSDSFISSNQLKDMQNGIMKQVVLLFFVKQDMLKNSSSSSANNMFRLTPQEHNSQDEVTICLQASLDMALFPGQPKTLKRVDSKGDIMSGDLRIIDGNDIPKLFFATIKSLFH
eukprot:CAMPEP_0114406608 /NCGR_PEP_ID=MMETSP0102-20121206/21347_1 /TAXON_ID=38822 ORGANISM="Pteridomonas danica, Strain PT" /NCGR_SAMPLE_ID=MMETSP0102 /ASSEMBLY_ACC=CAM_ASM_000212 /LENGTH=129 /DNA_ID=CAMNT_0001572715 /DNA_START=97 /DNA_END=486 /DNA_ORIENTATION=+